MTIIRTISCLYSKLFPLTHGQVSFVFSFLTVFKLIHFKYTEGDTQELHYIEYEWNEVNIQRKTENQEVLCVPCNRKMRAEIKYKDQSNFNIQVVYQRIKSGDPLLPNPPLLDDI